MTLQDIVDGAPTWAGPDRRTLRQAVVAVLGMLAFAGLFGTAAGLVLYGLLVKALAYLT